MRIFFTFCFFMFLLATCWILANRIWRRNSLLNGPGALGILIGFQAILLNFLSLFKEVTAISLLSGNLIFVLIIIFFEIRRLGIKGLLFEYGGLIKSHVDLWSGRSNPWALLLIPLLAILFFTALVHSPNNWDSMVYHMARIVYWMENCSIDYYPTIIERQNVMNPGAEYLILLLQLFSASDFLANMVQFISYYLLLCAMPSFLRLLGIRRSIANVGLILAASLPMGILQATSTQNDLVAACMTLALVAAAFKFWHKTIRVKMSGLNIWGLGLLSAVGYLVKVTAVFAALPFLFMAVTCYSFTLIRSPQLWKRQGINLLLGIVLIGIISGPDLYRKIANTGSVTAKRTEVYPLKGFWAEKMIHSFVGINFHVIPNEKFYKHIIEPLMRFFNVNKGYFPRPEGPFNQHEDWSGNPMHMIFAGFAVLLFLFRFSKIPRVAKWSVVFICLSWIILHAMIHYQPWISRLQTPIFMLFPCFLAVWSPISKIKQITYLFTGLMITLTMACLVYGFQISVGNDSRPLIIKNFWRLDRDADYYVNRGLNIPHETAITIANALKIKKMAIAVGLEEYDYPLSWRLYRSGIEVRHLINDRDLEWADAVYAPDKRPSAIKDWAEYGSLQVKPGFVEKIVNPKYDTVYTQIFDFKSLKADGPDYEEKREFLFVLMPNDLVDAEVLSASPMEEKSKAHFILCQYPDWEKNFVFYTYITTKDNSAHMSNIVTCKIEKPIVTWRNWGGADALPVTKIILTVRRLHKSLAST